MVGNIFISVLILSILLVPGEVVGFGMIDLFGSLVGFLNNQADITEFGEITEYKELVMNDHSNDEIFLSTAQEIIERSQFEQETFEVLTPDGYITQLIHVMNPLADKSKLKGPPLLLLHGGLIDPVSWIWGSAIQHHPEKYPRDLDEDGPITSSNRSLGFMLTNYGYDVWLAGTRGCNAQNLGHTKYDTRLIGDILDDTKIKSREELARQINDTLEYYNFSQDPVIELEYPKQIDTVLRLTGKEKVSILTYSLSTQMIFALLASNKVYSKKIHSLVAIAPILNREGTSNFWLTIHEFLLDVTPRLGNFILQIILSKPVHKVARLLDRYTIVYLFIVLAAGSSPKYQSFIEDSLVGHSFGPISFTMAKHYAQQVKAGKLQKFDYGSIKNREIYNGSDTPPVYDLKNIKIKHWMQISSMQDLLGTPDSAEQYYKHIPNKPDKYIMLHKWNHIDMAIGVDNDVKVNMPILEFLDKFSSPSSESHEPMDQ